MADAIDRRTFAATIGVMTEGRQSLGQFTLSCLCKSPSGAGPDLTGNN